MFANTKKLYAALVTAGALVAAPVAQAATTFNFHLLGDPGSAIRGSLTLAVGASGDGWNTSGIDAFSVYGGTYGGVSLFIDKTMATDGPFDGLSGSGTATWPPTQPFGVGKKMDAEDYDPPAATPPVGVWGSDYFYKITLTDTTLEEQVKFTYCPAGVSCSGSGGAGNLVSVDTIKTHNIEFAPVPIPAALPLFASALVGLGVIARRRKTA